MHKCSLIISLKIFY
uniref:Uncharacterized protein n=1 Tax=Rhizophora mucronata TaxID=61149 RepID=A0A2P2R4R1_RHIMU